LGGVSGKHLDDYQTRTQDHGLDLRPVTPILRPQPWWRSGGRERDDFYPGGEIDGTRIGVVQRLLLGTDGTVTQLLATCVGEGIRAVILCQHLRLAGDERHVLGLGRRRRILDRRVLLRGTVTGRDYICGESLIALDRLAPAMSKSLLRTEAPIGLLLREHRTETFREILHCGMVPARDLAVHFGTSEATPLLARTYRVWIDRRPAMLITEKFPQTYGPELPPSVPTDA
jgi:chorismate-pyruvate lyase